MPLDPQGGYGCQWYDVIGSRCESPNKLIPWCELIGASTQKSKSTENGEQSQPIRKNDPLFLAQLYVQESTTDDTSQEVVFVKREARVLVNGKGFRYRVQTGELISATRRTTRSSSTAGEFQLQPTACRAIQASLYAQV